MPGEAPGENRGKPVVPDPVFVPFLKSAFSRVEGGRGLLDGHHGDIVGKQAVHGHEQFLRGKPVVREKMSDLATGMYAGIRSSGSYEAKPV